MRNGQLSMRVQHRVNLEETHCTRVCNYPYRLPYQYMTAFLKQLDAVPQYIDDIYKLSSYSLAFMRKNVRFPLDQDLEMDAVAARSAAQSFKDQKDSQQRRGRGTHLPMQWLRATRAHPTDMQAATKAAGPRCMTPSAQHTYSSPCD